LSVPGSFRIRSIAVSDSLEELTSLLHRAYAALGAMGFNYTAVNQSVAMTREGIADKECYLALIGEQLIGTLVLGPAGKDQAVCEWYRRPGIWIIGRFAVDPGARAQGIGSRLLAFAERRASDLGAVEAALDTAEGAEHLLDFYAKRGYRQVDQVQWQGKNYRSLVLSKALTGHR